MKKWFLAMIFSCSAIAGLRADFDQIAKDSHSAIVLLGQRDSTGSASFGTGFFVDTSGVVVTNYHVIMGARSIDVTTSKGRIIPVKGILAVDTIHDLAVLQVDANWVPVLVLADPRDLKPYAPMVVMGHTMGKGRIYTSAILQRFRDMPDDSLWLQFSGRVTPGFSGGPVLNEDGRVVGMTTKKLTSTDNANFAISSADIQKILEQARTHALVTLADMVYTPLEHTAVPSKDTEHARIWLAAADDWFYKDAAKAEHAMERALNYDGSLFPVYNQLAILKANRGDNAGAIEALQTAIKMDKNYVTGLVNLAKIYESVGRNEDAWPLYIRASQLSPEMQDIQDGIRRLQAKH